MIVGRHIFGCGQCMPCLVNKRRLWTHRILLEAKCHEENCFVTLTYRPVHYVQRGPFDYSAEDSLRPEHLSGWLKRLRARIEPRRIRFFSCGEYGDKDARAHFHAALFGYPWCRGGPYKRVDYPSGKVGRECQCSSCLDVRESWGFGFTSLLPLEVSRAAYIAKYVTKKWTSKTDGRLNGRAPEFARMSLRPHGIGAPAMERVALVSAKYPAGRQRLAPVMAFGKAPFPLGRYLKTKLYEYAGSQPIQTGGTRSLSENQDRVRLLRMVAEQCNVSVKVLLQQVFERSEEEYRAKGTL